MLFIAVIKNHVARVEPIRLIFFYYTSAYMYYHGIIWVWDLPLVIKLIDSHERHCAGVFFYYGHLSQGRQFQFFSLSLTHSHSFWRRRACIVSLTRERSQTNAQSFARHMAGMTTVHCIVQTRNDYYLFLIWPGKEKWVSLKTNNEPCLDQFLQPWEKVYTRLRLIPSPRRPMLRWFDLYGRAPPHGHATGVFFSWPKFHGFRSVRPHIAWKQLFFFCLLLERPGNRGLTDLCTPSHRLERVFFFWRNDGAGRPLQIKFYSSHIWLMGFLTGLRQVKVPTGCCVSRKVDQFFIPTRGEHRSCATHSMGAPFVSAPVACQNLGWFTVPVLRAQLCVSNIGRIIVTVCHGCALSLPPRCHGICGERNLIEVWTHVAAYSLVVDGCRHQPLAGSDLRLFPFRTAKRTRIWYELTGEL